MRIRNSDIQIGEQHYLRLTDNPKEFILKSLQSYMKVGYKNNKPYVELPDLELTQGDILTLSNDKSITIENVKRISRGRVLITFS